MAFLLYILLVGVGFAMMDRKRACIHEMGHALMVSRFSPPFVLEQVRVGQTLFRRMSEIDTLETKHKQLMISLGGLAAERMLYIGVGACEEEGGERVEVPLEEGKHDYREAIPIARDILSTAATSSVEPQPGHVSALIDMTLQECILLLQENRDQLVLLSSHLYIKGFIDGKTITNCYRRNRFHGFL